MERIAAALGVTLGEFFHTAEQSPAKVVRADHRQTLQSGWSNARIESLAGGEPSLAIQPVLVTLKPGGKSAKAPYPAPSVEFALVLTGQVMLTLQSQEHEMSEGDAVTIPKGAMRQWQNVSSKLTRFLIVSAH
jgi:quercetin dioxygenase-like cupin family protein